MKNSLKFCCAALALVMGLSIITPSISAYATEYENTYIKLDIGENGNYEKKQIETILKEVRNETGISTDCQETPSAKVQERKVVSLLTKLAKKLGKGYIKTKLPKKIYSKMPAFVKSRISQSAFVGGWNTYILMGPADEVKSRVSSWLKKRGVWGWIANSAGYIAQGVVWALLP
ncbi:hypothetical protein ACYRFT_10735 [Listeria kieliensis]